MANITEWCPHCHQEVELKEEFVQQPCTNCKTTIKPCNQCFDIYGDKRDCNNCPLGKDTF